MITKLNSKTVLEELVRLRKSPLLPMQSTIAREIGEYQPFVSNASRGILKRVTTRVTKLYKYASSRIKAEERARKAAQSAEDEIGREIDDFAFRTHQRANGDTMRTVDPVVNEALSDLKAYLNDGYDPRLIVEQLVVLRRAQKLRRRGRRTEAATMP